MTFNDHSYKNKSANMKIPENLNMEHKKPSFLSNSNAGFEEKKSVDESQ